jgi:hypothetical protein
MFSARLSSRSDLPRLRLSPMTQLRLLRLRRRPPRLQERRRLRPSCITTIIIGITTTGTITTGITITTRPLRRRRRRPQLPTLPSKRCVMTKPGRVPSAAASRLAAPPMRRSKPRPTFRGSRSRIDSD